MSEEKICHYGSSGILLRIAAGGSYLQRNYVPCLAEKYQMIVLHCRFKIHGHSTFNFIYIYS